MRGLTAALAIARKDLRTELRTKESFNSSLSFSIVILVLFSFAFDIDRESFYGISGGMLWMVFSFAGALIVNRSFARELPNDCLDVLIASPAPGWAVYLGKTVAAFVTLLMVELFSLPVFGLFYNVAWWHSFGMLALVIVLATWGIAIVGVGFSAVTVNIRLRELMLPVLLYPILIPVLLGAMGTSTALFSGDPVLISGNGSALRLVAVFDLIYTAAGLYMIESILVI